MVLDDQSVRGRFGLAVVLGDHHGVGLREGVAGYVGVGFVGAHRKREIRAVQASGQVDQLLANLLLHNTTGLMTNLVSGYDLPAEIKVVSCMTLRDIVSAFDEIDYIESDIQQSEILVFPPAMALLKKKVRRIHIGTHGNEVHAELRRLFIADGWDIVFDFAPNSHFETTLGPFDTNDGILTVSNPTLHQPTAA